MKELQEMKSLFDNFVIEVAKLTYQIKDLEVNKSEAEAEAEVVFEFCSLGYSVFDNGDICPSKDIKTKDFASIHRTEEIASKRRRMLYLQNVEFQLTEYFNGGQECDWNDSLKKYSIAYDHSTKKNFITYNRNNQVNTPHFTSREGAERALPYYIEAVERYDKGEV